MMDKSKLVLGLLEISFGPGKKDRNTYDYTFYCPFCKHHKPKLVVNVESGFYNCFTCHPPTKGANPVYLLKKVKAHPDHVNEMKSYFSDRGKKEEVGTDSIVTLPKEFRPLYDSSDKSFDKKRAMSYLISRGITEDDVKRYNIGYCSLGRFQDRIIVPSYGANGLLNYFVARSMDKNSNRKYDAPSCKKSSIVGLESLVNWKIPVILCEGAFDAIAIKRNAIPLFGSSISEALMERLVDGQVKTVYLALDKDALRKALDYSEKLLNYGKDVYLLDLEGKDPSDVGFKGMVQLLHGAKKLDFLSLFKKKIEIS